MGFRSITAAPVFVLLSGLSFPGVPAFQIEPRMPIALDTGNTQVYNRELSLIDEPGHRGIRLSKAYGEGANLAQRRRVLQRNDRLRY